MVYIYIYALYSDYCLPLFLLHAIPGTVTIADSNLRVLQYCYAIPECDTYGQ